MRPRDVYRFRDDGVFAFGRETIKREEAGKAWAVGGPDQRGSREELEGGG